MHNNRKKIIVSEVSVLFPADPIKPFKITIVFFYLNLYKFFRIARKKTEPPLSLQDQAIVGDKITHIL